ncbi:single-stranded-DNA-specific exonuclease RecJ [Alteromonas sp. H39]|uniref:single-stranded-DNA-specific exonuclease RecJ n=1 Tax=Alteromonas sp. H39 TaxID=3389876 RepID=UPI0039E128B0
MPLPIIRRKVSGEPLSSDLHPVIERIYRARSVASIDDIDTGARGLVHYQKLKGITSAASLLADAVYEQTPVVIVGDFDADGATSTAVCMLSLRQMGLSTVDYLVPNRFDFGYGLSKPIVDMAHQQGAKVIVTVDNGISCLEGVAHAKSLGMQVIVTDHHLPGEVLPDADAIVNPNQPGCDFPSKSLAGVGVAFYLMLACRAELQQRDWFTAQGIGVPNLADLLDIVAVGTVADVVSLDKNNRILVHQGLQRIRSGKCRPGIKAIIEVANRQLAYLSASDLGFVVGPRLNAAGRLDDMAMGIACLLEDDTMQARLMAAELDSLNQQRREIETGMREEAMQVVASLTLDTDVVPPALVLYKDNFHQGVIGIVAGRIKEQYNRPVIAFAHQDDEVIKGSARSISGIHIRDVLDEVNTSHPGLIEKFGGHAMAAGLSLPLANLDDFTQAFTRICEKHLERRDDTDAIWSDGELTPQELDLSFAHMLRQSGPFGQGFEAPVFDGIFELVQQRIVGEKHLKVTFRLPGGGEIDGIAFNVDTTQWPAHDVRHVKVAYQLDVNVFRGRESVQMLVEQILPHEH